MCTHGTTTVVRCPAGFGGSVLASERGETNAQSYGHPHRIDVPVDACIAPIVAALNEAGILTLGACCGHGKGPGSILLADGRELIVEQWAP